MGNLQAWKGQRRGGGQGYRQKRVRGSSGSIGMMVQRQVTPGWEDDPVRR